ncbi:hypothetical protein CAPTEDRAFT_190467 [Capitella teleta]|uniref:Uncharacterized protein n=1 Tax=Capitella teleta TaxID=283909 RepID=R7UVR1_CAPTE|nr:hypothetical protein CAPTEDRAFT_190467 [Capitella teleta]|eukprot:ELU10414.1 hypothetical protein CAPTEDRAFT_190467 [Capitella teleta]
MKIGIAFSADGSNCLLQLIARQFRYHPGKLNIRADMLSRIAAINLDPAPAPAFDLQEIPEIWRADQIDPDELIRAQKDEFEDQWIEATQEQDASPFVIDSGILYSLAEPHRHAGRYPRLMLPHAYRQKVIDRCHIEVAHAAFAKTLARVQESYLWSDERLHNLHTASEFLKQHHEASKARYRAQESPSATALSPGTFVSIRVLSPRKGQPKWQPGFQIIGSRGPALRIRNVETSKIYRLNQRDVRVIPEILPYEEIDPLPPKKDRKENDLPEAASPLILPDEPTVCSPPTTKAL